MVRRFRKNDFKLIHVTKAYNEGEAIRSDNFWKRETRIGNIKIVWMCKQTVEFNGGFKFSFDFDYWFEFSKFLQILRGELYEKGFPYTPRPYAEDFGREEATRALNEVKKKVNSKLKKRTEGWGKHGIIQDVTERKSLEICHQDKIEISSISELERFRKKLSKILEGPRDLLKNSEKELYSLAKEKLEELIPLEIDPYSLEGYLAFFLWFRNPGGGFEYQLYRFVWENFEKRIKKKDIRDALLRLEVHGYAKVRETSQELRKNMRKRGIKRSKRFYELGRGEVPGRKLPDKLKRRTHIGAYLAPLPKKDLIKRIDAPDHILNRKIDNLERKNYLSKRKVKDFLGRTVKKIKPRKGPGGCNGLERKIIKKAGKFYEIQKTALDEMQEERP